jgi:hypothetical protein
VAVPEPLISSCLRNATACAELAWNAETEEAKGSWLVMVDFWKRRLSDTAIEERGSIALEESLHG